MKIACLVIDDEPVARKGLASYVNQTPFLELVGTCKSALEATSLLSEKSVDLLFLDIQMPEISGIDFVRSLDDPPAVIFTTAYRDYAIEGFELNALDYLVKPISFQRFLKAANKALNFFELQRQPQTHSIPPQSEYFFIKSDGQFIKIWLDDVLYFESEKDYVFIYTRQKRYLTLISLKQLERELPEDRFLRVHRSFIVALDKIELLDGNMIVIGEKKIPISRNLQDTIYNRLIAGRLWKRET
ncbi:MAG: DNA-binding response regulator [Saprospiraceae bacterium]|nr:MAG: DNA-binding response regulator [Saprospiraceae bacterium]